MPRRSPLDFLLPALLSLLAVSPLGAQCGDVNLIPAENSAGDLLGFGLSIEGDLALVGGRLHDFPATDAGAAYLFERTAAGWVEIQTLRASDPIANAQFGASVLLHGAHAFVGALTIGNGRGKVYVFERTDQGWVETAQLVASRRGPDDNFGLQMSASGDELLVGARLGEVSLNDSGAAFLFQKTPQGWVETHIFEPDNPLAASRFGHAVHLQGERAAIGAFGANNFRGRAYVFERVGGIWVQTANLTAGARAQDDRFGIAVGLSGDDLLVGCRRDDAAGTNVGSLYVFRRVATSWNRVQKLFPSFTGNGEEFGARLAVRGDRALVGGFAQLGGRAGAAYVMERQDRRWAEVRRLQRANPQRGDSFGFDLGLTDDTALIGAFQADVVGLDSGVAVLHPLTRTVLAASPRQVTAGTSVTLRVCGGAPGQPVQLFLAARDGIPVGQPLPLIGTFDAAGQAQWGALIPSAVAQDLALQALSLTAAGALEVSSTTTLEVR